MSRTFSNPPTVSIQPKYLHQGMISLDSTERNRPYRDISTLTLIELITIQNTGTAT